MFGKVFKRGKKMRKAEVKHLKQLFICTNCKENGGCCSSKGSEQIIADLKTRLKAEDKWYLYKVTKSGCLGGCADGINAVLYPEKTRYEKVQTTDVDELYNLLTQE
jgi:(2Fe-2S) ferredoxin